MPISSYIFTAWLLPFTAMRSSSRQVNWLATCWYVPSAITTEIRYVFVIPSSREARFTLSPITVHASRFAEPMFPTFTGPVFNPIPIASGARPSDFHLRFSFSSPRIICSAHLHPRIA